MSTLRCWLFHRPWWSVYKRDVDVSDKGRFVLCEWCGRQRTLWGPA